MTRGRQRRMPQVKARRWAAGAAIFVLLATLLLACRNTGTDEQPAGESHRIESERTPVQSAENDSGVEITEREIEKNGKSQIQEEDRAAAKPDKGPESAAPPEPGNGQTSRLQEAKPDDAPERSAPLEPTNKQPARQQQAKPDDAPERSAPPGPTNEQPGQQLVAPKATQQAIADKYEPQLRALQASCEAKAAQLAEQIAGDWASLASSDAEDIKKIYNKYADRLAQAEADCSSGWEQIAAEARKELKEAGLEDTLTDEWRSQYEKAKNEAQAKALARLEQMMTPGP